MHDEVKNNVTEKAGDESVLMDIAASGLDDDNVNPDVAKDIENLRRWGFQYAVKERNTNLLTADDVLLKYTEKRLVAQERWLAVYATVQNRYKAKIETINGEIKDLEGKKLLDDPTRIDLIKRRDELEAAIKECYKRVVEVRQRMVAGKQNMTNKCVDEVSVQIDNAIGLQRKAYDETTKILREQFDDTKNSREEAIKQLSVKRTNLQERQAEVSKRMKLISADGINPAMAYLLIGIGTSGAAAAGYFFSIFTSNTNFSSQDSFFFLLNGLLEAGRIPGPGLLAKIGILLLFVFVIGLISYACYRIFEHLFNPRRKQKKDYSRFDTYGRIVTENSSFSAEIKAGNWFSFWLQISPIVIIAGLLILLLGLNHTVPKDIAQLNSSIEGVLAGTAMALGVGGLMCIYIMKIIEPRLLQKREDEKAYVNWLRNNWELTGCLLVFIVVTLGIIFYPISGSKPNDTYSNAIAVSEFVAVSLLSAFSFGYGIRFRGLIAVNGFLQRQIDFTDGQVWLLKDPEHPTTNAHYNSINDVVNQILKVAESRVALLRVANGREAPEVAAKKDENVNGQFQNLLKRFRRTIQQLFGKRHVNTESPIYKLAELEEWELRYFPDVAEELKLISAECADHELEHKNLVNSLDKIDSEYSSEAEEKKEKRKKLQKDIETLYTYQEKAEMSKNKRLTQHDEFLLTAETAILDGFHLGVWYRENQMGPVADFYYAGPYASAEGFRDENGKEIKLLGYGNS